MFTGLQYNTHGELVSFRSKPGSGPVAACMIRLLNPQTQQTYDIVLEDSIVHSWAPEELGNLVAISQEKFLGDKASIKLYDITTSPLTATPKKEFSTSSTGASQLLGTQTAKHS